jgi:hypothetical protein
MDKIYKINQKVEVITGKVSQINKMKTNMLSKAEQN